MEPAESIKPTPKMRSLDARYWLVRMVSSPRVPPPSQSLTAADHDIRLLTVLSRPATQAVPPTCVASRYDDALRQARLRSENRVGVPGLDQDMSRRLTTSLSNNGVGLIAIVKPAPRVSVTVPLRSGSFPIVACRSELSCAAKVSRPFPIDVASWCLRLISE